jgi:hypothetical protein
VREAVSWDESCEAVERESTHTLTVVEPEEELFEGEAAAVVGEHHERVGQVAHGRQGGLGRAVALVYRGSACEVERDVVVVH